MENLASLLRKEIGLYVDASEFWQAEHEAAMDCYGFEDVLERGVRSFEKINRFDEAWRLAVLKQKQPYDSETQKLIFALYVIWHIPCRQVLADLDALEKQFDVKHAEKFRACCREVVGILTNDEEFFGSSQLAALRDQALEEHSGGQTIEHGAG